MSLLETVLLGVQGLLGVAVVAAGGTKLAGVDSQVEVFEHLGYPQWFRVITGGLEVAAGIALLAGFVVAPRLALAGSLLAVIVLVGALGSHVRAGDSPGEMVPAAVLLVLAALVTWGHVG
jgi:uncharacterized membrane protein YphA (DoxX/SURF4 family)